MRAITTPEFGGPDALTLTDLPDPEPGHGEVLIEVAAAGVNRADIQQRQGKYPAPPGAPDWPGLEVSGTIVGRGDGVTEFSVGDRVCALLPGGGYASLAVAPIAQVLPVPDSLDLADAAGLPEAIATVWSNVFMLAGLRAGETLLVHGGSSGIGTIAVQLGRIFGCLVAVTASSEDKLAAAGRLGAEILIDYSSSDFVSVLQDATEGRGADVILDPVGGDYVDRNLHALARHGRLVLIANQSGQRGKLDIRLLMSKWGSIHATTLRARPTAEKDEILQSVLTNVWPLVESGQLSPVIDSRFPLAEANRAHRHMESGAHIGKILLIP
jgi:putative PIG3 family NAD(P)H quinone oxidoreductase